MASFTVSLTNVGISSPSYSFIIALISGNIRSINRTATLGISPIPIYDDLEPSVRDAILLGSADSSAVNSSISWVSVTCFVLFVDNCSDDKWAGDWVRNHLVTPFGVYVLLVLPRSIEPFVSVFEFIPMSQTD